MWPLADLPSDISDRFRVQLIELYLRIFDEYIGGIIEKIAGPQARNSFLRLLTSIGFMLSHPDTKNVEIHDEKISGIRVRCYTPTDFHTNCALIYLHGGGWSTMRPENYDSAVIWFVKKLGIKAFSVDYRLAPEYPFPAAFEDCSTVVEYLHEFSEKYAIDKDKIIVAGDSAGGQLAAALAQKLKHLIRCQVLIYPATSYFAFNLPSYKEYYERFNGMAALSPESVARWTLMYMGIPADKKNIQKILKGRHIGDAIRATPQYRKYLSWDRIKQMYPNKNYENKEFEEHRDISTKFEKALDPAISPLFGVTYDLPPAIVVTCGYDVLRDEGIVYYRELKETGVDVTWRHYPTGFHGVVNLGGSRLRETIFNDISDFIKIHLE